MANIQDIQIETARFYGISREDMRGKSRCFKVSHPRQVAMYLCREKTRASLPQIGDKFGKDHTTAIHAHKAVKKRLKENPKLAANVNKIKEKLWLRDVCRSLSSGRTWSR